MPSSMSLPLHTAIKLGDEYKFILLLENGADVHLEDEGSGGSCLHLCIKAAFEDTFFIETLIEFNADIDATYNTGQTPFCEAVARKQFRTANLLLKAGANPNHVDGKNTTILGIILTRHDNILPCLRYLLEPGHHLEPASFIVEDRGCSTALHLASGARWTKRLPKQMSEVMKYLLSKFPYEEHLEAKELTSGFTALFCAVLANNFEAVKELLAAGASLDTQANAGISLRGAKFIWLYGRSLGFFKEKTYSTDDEAFIKKWKKMGRLLLQASEDPIVLPKKRQRSAKDDPLYRLNRFMELAAIAQLSAPEVSGMECFTLPENRKLTDEEKRKLFVPKEYLAEAEVLTHDDARRSHFIVSLVGYAFQLQKNSERYALMPMMPHTGVIAPLAEFLQSDPPLPLGQRLQIGLDIVSGMQIVHGSGFTHGCLQPRNIYIISVAGRPESSYCAQLWNFEKSVSIEDDPSDLVYRRQENEYDPPHCRQQQRTELTFEDLKRCDLFSIGVLILFICGNGGINAPGNFETNPAFYQTAVAAMVDEAEDENTWRAIAEVLIPCVSGIVEPSPNSQAKGLQSLSFALGVVLEAVRNNAG